MLYPHSLEKIRRILRENFGAELEAKESDLKYSHAAVSVGGGYAMNIASHLLWMCDRVEEMSREESARAGRWIGWMLAYLELLTPTTNADSRDMVRVDVRAGDC